MHLYTTETYTFKRLPETFSRNTYINTYTYLLLYLIRWTYRKSRGKSLFLMWYLRFKLVTNCQKAGIRNYLKLVFYLFFYVIHQLKSPNNLAYCLSYTFSKSSYQKHNYEAYEVGKRYSIERLDDESMWWFQDDKVDGTRQNQTSILSYLHFDCHII